MKNLFINRKIITALCGTALFIMLGLLVSKNVYSWYLSNSDIAANTNEIYTVHNGYFNNNLYETESVALLSNDESAANSVSLIPGDVVYYSFVCDITSTEYTSTKNWTVLLQIETENGLEFLKDCKIESNSCIITILERTDNSGISTYTPLWYKDGAESTSTTTGAVCLLNSLTTPSFTNSANESLSDGTSIDARIAITLPTIEDIASYSDGDISHIYMRIFIPIWYRDTGIDQSEEMGSSITVNECYLAPSQN